MLQNKKWNVGERPVSRKIRNTSIPKESGNNSPSTGKRKTNKREDAVNPALQPKYNLKTRTDLLDQDYLHKLSPDELAWLNKFNEEEVNASYKKNNKENLGKTKKEKKASYTRNNARNRCILTRQKAAGRLKSLEDVEKKQLNPVDAMNLAIDLKLLDLVDDNGQAKKKKS